MASRQTAKWQRSRCLRSVADIPPIHANWTGLPVKVVAARFRQDPVNHPVYQIGIAPGAPIKTLADLRGKKIAYSLGQAQGALVLRILKKIGLSKNDVQLVELPSTTDVYAKALIGNLVDAAPLGGVFAKRYVAQYGRDGAHLISHGLRDDPAYLYAPVTVLDVPSKAAAIREYVKFWARAQLWIETHPNQWAKGYSSTIRDFPQPMRVLPSRWKAKSTYQLPGRRAFREIACSPGALRKVIAGQMHAPIRCYSPGVYRRGGRLEYASPVLIEESYVFCLRPRFTKMGKVVERFLRHEHFDLPATPFDGEHERVPTAELGGPAQHVRHAGNEPHAGTIVAFARKEDDAMVLKSQTDRPGAAHLAATTLLLIIAHSAQSYLRLLGELFLRPVE
jgi:hypothetical protein